MSVDSDGYLQGCPSCGNTDLDEFYIGGIGFINIRVNFTGATLQGVSENGYPDDYDVDGAEVDYDSSEIYGGAVEYVECTDIYCCACDHEFSHLVPLDPDWCAENGYDWEEFMGDKDTTPQSQTKGANPGTRGDSLDEHFVVADNALKMEDGHITYGDHRIVDNGKFDQRFRLAGVSLMLAQGRYVNLGDEIRRWDIENDHFDKNGDFDPNIEEHWEDTPTLKVHMYYKQVYIWVPNRYTEDKEDLTTLRDVVYIVERNDTESRWDTDWQKLATVIKTERSQVSKVLEIVFNIHPNVEKEKVYA